jgi:hypothetical protein
MYTNQRISIRRIFQIEKKIKTFAIVKGSLVYFIIKLMRENKKTDQLDKISYQVVYQLPIQ